MTIRAAAAPTRASASRRSRRCRSRYRFADADELWFFVSELRGPVALALAELDDDERAAVRAEIEAARRPRRRRRLRAGRRQPERRRARSVTDTMRAVRAPWPSG